MRLCGYHNGWGGALHACIATAAPTRPGASAGLRAAASHGGAAGDVADPSGAHSGALVASGGCCSAVGASPKPAALPYPAGCKAAIAARNWVLNLCSDRKLSSADSSCASAERDGSGTPSLPVSRACNCIRSSSHLYVRSRRREIPRRPSGRCRQEAALRRRSPQSTLARDFQVNN